MKFNSLQELWSYCLFCPICRRICRDIEISVAPDNTFTLVSFKKEDHWLKLHCTYRQQRVVKYKVDYSINCLTNKYLVEVSEMIDASNTSDMTADKNLEEEELHRKRFQIAKSYFYFYIFGNCEECNVSWTNSTDIEFNNKELIVYNVCVDRDSIYIMQPKDKYHLTICYDENKTIISRCIVDNNFNLVDDYKTFECSVINFDFSNPQKVVNKIKTLITFS